MSYFKNIKRFIQRRTRGWDDSETWSLDASLAKLILPRLRRFQEVTAGHPSDVTEAEWNETLNKMIDAFAFIGTDEYYDRSDEQDALVQAGLKLFAENYTRLWW